MKLCLFGASPDTPNLGVSALFLSVLDGIASREPRAEVTVFDFGRGVRDGQVRLKDRTFAFTRCGANLSRRYYRRDSLLNMRVSAALGGLGNPGVRAIDEADAVLDISGGDSFTDLYGEKRFQGITQPKRLTLRLRTPLVLLPQTYGPFDDPAARTVAQDVVRGTSMAWARDARSFAILRELLGEAFDADRHREGVDVAFALPRRQPAEVPATLQRWLEADRSAPVVGFNVSGLVHNGSGETAARFDFAEKYREIVQRLLARLLAESDARIVLVPHVLARRGHYESDPQACDAVAAALADDERVFVLDHDYDAMEIKWVISRFDFFCGTRMHSAIAGLSSSVPTAAIAYSDKTLGVFESCGQGRWVTDPRRTEVARCVDLVWDAWQQREHVSASLRHGLPDVLDRATEQTRAVLDHVERLVPAGQPPAGG